MYLMKNNQSPFYQIVYFVNGKRTTRSTRTTNEKEAQRILFEFQNSVNYPQQSIVQQPLKNNSPLYLLSTTMVFSCVGFLNFKATGNSKNFTEGCEVV